MNILKKQGVAWVITAVMIVIAITIGRGKADPGQNTPRPDISAPLENFFYVFDDAGVLSADEEQDLGRLNEDLYAEYGTVVACVTTNYGREDLFDYALNYAEGIGLGQYDFIVVLDISGDNYWLVQGDGLLGLIGDDECGEYARTYMEDHFARGDYGSALIELTKALSQWYDANS